MGDVVIVSAARTPIGGFNGALKRIAATKLGSLVIAEAVGRAGLEPGQVDEGGVAEKGGLVPEQHGKGCTSALDRSKEAEAMNKQTTRQKRSLHLTVTTLLILSVMVWFHVGVADARGFHGGGRGGFHGGAHGAFHGGFGHHGLHGGFSRHGFHGGFSYYGGYPYHSYPPYGYPSYGYSASSYPPYGSCYAYEAYGRCESYAPNGGYDPYY